MTTMTEAVGLNVAATLLGEKPFHFETVLEYDNAGNASFLSAHQIILGSPVKLETPELLWLATVLTCRREAGRWRATLRIEHLLRNLPELLKLAARFE